MNSSWLIVRADTAVDCPGLAVAALLLNPNSAKLAIRPELLIRLVREFGAAGGRRGVPAARG
ncbi:MAG: hypothetical protein JNL54_11815 [Kineosporiaceae bacterium]|nr:hypothetical protein [Kineosporiaceae bacterium]